MKAAHDGWSISPPQAEGGVHSEATGSSTRRVLCLSSSWLPRSRSFVQKTRNDVQKAGKTGLYERKYIALERGNPGIQLSLVFGKERLKVALINKRGALWKITSIKTCAFLDTEVATEPGFEELPRKAVQVF